MRIAVAALDGLFDSGLSVVLDVLATANSLRDDAAGSPSPFEVVVTGLGSTARTGHGLAVQTVPLSDLGGVPDVFVMPALAVQAPSLVIKTVREHPLVERIRDLRDAGAMLAAACTGTFFLAESGVLDGRVATTSWWLGSAFRSRYPAIALDDSRTLVTDGQVTTAGAAFAHIDLAISLVRQHSPELAELVGRYLVTGDRPSQAAFAVPSLLAGTDPLTAEFERWIRDHLAEPLQVAEIARKLGVSERTLQRSTAAVLGMSPLDFIQEVRIDQATYLLRTTNRTAGSVAAAVGYQNVGTLRGLVRRRRDTTLSNLRRT
ncbi:MAG: HTH-type transcriptional activator rhaS [Amycolatopsis sp.]|uniref:GlxA family transcriptional regulator n=1 Tax=Amycolatopsis sp. TaxID=37632 RepID=UPI00262B757D|nr:helix-turn-helix domain-containing protein [Amycolatopsis sp.]MCU1687363.1 HTH-type transcriptional activator rhaS [Amycolatopsis sp.]